MYRTDKQFMKNPATASSRIYIGSLNVDTVIPDHLEERFKVHGNILGLVLQRGFGFIQYENEAQAQNAIKMEHGTMFHDRKLIVKQAFDNKKANLGNQGPPVNVPLVQSKPPPGQLTPQVPLSENDPEMKIPSVSNPQEIVEGHSPDKRFVNKWNYWPRGNDRMPPPPVGDPHR